MYNIESINKVKKIILKILESGQSYSFLLIENSMDAHPMLIRTCIWDLIEENEIELCDLLSVSKKENKIVEQVKCLICDELMEREGVFLTHSLGECTKLKKEKMKPATNNPDLEFKPLTSEEWREYTFLVPISTDKTFSFVVKEHKMRIERPQALNVSKSGGHRIQAENGNGIYIPSGWVKLEWKNKETVESSIQF